MAQEAARKEVAKIKLHRLLANKSPLTARIPEWVNRKRIPRRRGPERILEIDEAGVAVKFQG